LMRGFAVLVISSSGRRRSAGMPPIVTIRGR
jgi:hypothetical protein